MFIATFNERPADHRFEMEAKTPASLAAGLAVE